MEAVTTNMRGIRERAAVARRAGGRSDAGQTAIVAVLALVLIIGIIGGTLVLTVVKSTPLQQTAALADYSNQAVTAGENAYVEAVNANPALAYCSTNTNGSGTCQGINYGEWNPITGSASSDTGAEYYTFGNPQPTFDPVTHELTNLAVEVVGAAKDPQSPTGYIFAHKVLNLAPKNGFLSHVWWSNYESYSPNGDYSTCGYNWSPGINYNIDGSNASCSSQVYFGPNDYLFGPTYTNDSVFVSGDGTQSGSPSFGNPNTSPPVPSAVQTADPNCQFVSDNLGTKNTDGMNGGHSSCTNANNEVHLWDQTNSSFGNAVESPPSTDSQLGTIANHNGCLYSGPTQITLSTNAQGVGQMTVVSPDTPVILSNGRTVDGNNLSTNTNDCPTNGTAVLPQNGVVFVQNATAGQAVTGANPYDDYITNSATNLTSSPAAPTPSNPVTLTATVTSAVSQISSGATVAFSQTTSTTQFGHTTTSSAVIPACSTVSNWSAPVPVGGNFQSTATCTTTEASNGTGAFSAVYSGGTYTATSQGNLGQSNSYSPTVSYAANSQTTAGGCTACYYGETGTPDSEGDAFVNGSLSGQLTIGTANDVIVDGNITYKDCSGQWVVGQSGSSAQSEGFCPYVPGGTNDSLGLIANEYVEVNHPVTSSGGSVLGACAGTPGALCDPSGGAGNVSTGTGGITIDAAILALTQSFVVNNYQSGGDEGPLYVYGSIQQYGRGPVGTFSGNSTASGYVKHYTWDPLLDFLAPPSYLVPTTPSWVLTSVTADSSAVPTTYCPTILPVYGSTQTVSQYCATNPGALPGYPSVTAPAPPTSVTATAGVGGFATVTWVDPASHGSPITRYNVSPLPSCSTCTGTTVLGANATSASIGGLTPGTSYVFTVTATNANGTSDPSLPSPSMAAPAVPYAPTQVTAAGNANDTVTVGWTDPASPGYPILRYNITPSPACGGCTGLVVNSATATSTTISGLTVGATYSFTVTATNTLGTGPVSLASNTVEVPTKPNAPTGVTATSFANGQSVVSWLPPNSNGGLTITGYTVTSSPGGKTCTTTGNTSCTVNGLTNGTPYTFTVTATNPIGTGPASAASAAATPAAVPGAPTIGSATATNGQATVTFTPPAANGGAPVTSYTVTSSPGGITATCASSPCTITGLSNGTSYTFKVAATNGAGTGSSSASSNSVTPIGPPVAPTSVLATSNNNAQSAVSWTASASTGGSPILHYTVTSSGGQTCTTANGSTTSCTVTGLTNGTSYTFTVTATNAIGTSPASAPSAPAVPATAPGAPTGVTAVTGYQQGTITWTAPASNGGALISGYTVTSSSGGKTCTTSTTSCIVTGLTNGTSYTFTVKATNSAGTGPASSASNAIVPVTTKPNPPTAVSASSFANTQSVVTWTAPTYTGGSPITKYTVTSSGGQTCTTANGTTTTCTVGGLTNGTAYTFTVTATNSIGTSVASAASAPATPSTVPGAPTSVTATSHASQQSVVSWTAPASNGGATITGYTVTSSPGSLTCTTTGATSCTVTGLTNGTSYTFTVKATNGSGTGASSLASAAIVPAAVPGAPTGVTATSNAASQSVVHWTAPASNGGLAITGYTVMANAGQTCTTTGAVTCTVTGLTNGVPYTFTVTATNAVGTGPASAASAPATPAGPPVAPTGVTATSGQNVSSTVSWTAPTDDGGSAITGYTVTASPGGKTCTTTGAVTCTVTGLTNGTTYTFTVTASNATGASPPSAPSNAVTPASTPGAPTGVTAVNVPNTLYGDAPSITVAWTAPASSGGSAIVRYTAAVVGGPQTCTTGNGSATTCTFLGLTAGTSYTFTVTATNAIGTGPASSQASATAATVPDAPGAVTGTDVPNIAYLSPPQVTVSWSAPATGGSPVTGYTATASPGGATCTSATTSCTITSGLTAGTAYAFKVTATNSAGTGSASAASPAVTAATVPQNPTIGTASYTTGIAYGSPPQVKVTWTDPANNGGNAISGYVVSSSPAGGTCTVSGVAATTCTIVSGLTAGTSYTFSVKATNAIGNSSASGSTSAVIPATVPAAPTGVGAVNVANTPYSNAPGAVVSWTASANGGAAVTGYSVTASPGGGTCSTTGTTCTVTGLTAGTAYGFTVKATNAAGTSQPSGTASLTAATVPQNPTIGSAAYVTGIAYGSNPQVTVNWTDPPNNGGAAISGYTVTANSGGGTCTASGATATTCTITSGLTAGTAYTFTVVANNTVGSSTASSASNNVTPATAPQPPTIGSVAYVPGIAYGSAPQVTVNWVDPANNGGAAVSSYTATASPGGATCTVSGATATSCTVTSGLTAGTAYTFTVKATNAAATSAASGTSASVTPATVPQTPTIGTATNVTGVTYGNNPQVTVTWTGGATGGSAITGYTVSASSGGGTCTSSGTSCTISSGLTAGSSYTFSVTATNGAGTSTSSGNSNSITPSTVPQAPTIGSASYTPGIIFGANPQVTVAWTDPAGNGGSAITGYTVTSSPAGGTCTASGATATSCTITSGLVAGTAYTFSVKATNVSGSSAASSSTASLTPATLPSVPTGVSATNVAGIAFGSAPQATVSWTASSNGGSPITGYTVTANSGGGTCTTSGTSCTITSNLVAGTSYTYTVTATNAAGATAASSASAAVTGATVPQAPTIGSAAYITGIANGSNPQVTVTWTDPAGNGGSAITGYTVSASSGSGTCTASGAIATTCTVTSGLTAGTAYTFTVKANNAAGSSVASGLSNSVTPATVPGAPTIGTATAVTGLPNGSNPQVAVTWTDPASNGGAAISGYTVTASPGGATCTASGATATTCTVTSGLVTGTSYTFTVTAANVAGTSAASGATSSVSPATVPAAPTAVSGTNVSGIAYLSNPQVTVSWTPGSNGGASVSSYNVTASPGGATCSSAGTSCTITSGLTAGTSYTFTVTATNSAGTGLASSASASVLAATVAQAPTIGTATVVGGIANGSNPQVTVTWTDPGNNGGTAITGYTVTANTGGGTCTASGATATTCTVTSNLAAGTAYTFTVKANNAAGSSAASPATSSVTPATVPGAPTIGTTTVVAGIANGSSPQAVVNWTVPASNGGSAITGYTVMANTGGGTCTVSGASTTSCTVNSNLTAGSSYTFTVIATNSAGNSVTSAASNSVTPATVASAPTSVTATSNANASSVVSWTASSSTGGSAITGYTVTSSPGGFTCTTTGASSCTVSGLTNGTAYTFTVKATNGEGQSLASTASSPATPATIPGAPTGVSGTSFGNGQSVVSWTAPASNGGAAITNYTVTSSPGGFTCNTSTTSCTVAGLTNGSSYTFTVTATNAVGTGPASSSSAAVVPATVPGAPTIGTATNVGGVAFGSTPDAAITWTDPASNGGTAITGYTVTSSPAGGTCTASGATATTCTITTGLAAGTAYTFTVTATNAAGTSTASAASNSITSATVPGAPTSVTATSNANASSVVSWTAPGSGGSAITGYTVTSSPGGFTCTTTGATSCTVSGLTNGTGYTFTVTATNSAGTGTASAASATATPAVAPGAPTGVTVAPTSTTTSVAVSWTAPSNGGAAITGYTVTSSPGSKTCTTATTGCTVSGLTAKTTYTFTVTATNAAGTSPASAASNSIIAGAPGASTIGSATNTTGIAYGSNPQTVVTWTDPTSNGGSAITGYTVTSSPAGGTCTASGATATSCTVTSGLTTGTAYTYSVTATNTNGTGPASGASSSTTASTVPQAPTIGTPSYTTGIANGSAPQVTVNWTDGANGGSTVTGYTVTSSPGGGTCTTAVSTATSCTITSGLTAGAAYTFTVTATNANGTGIASSASNGLTPATVPDVPTSVATSATTSSTQLSVAWSAPADDGGSAITGYTVTSSPGSKTCTTTGATTCTVTGLTAKTGYTFTVTATNAAGTGLASTASAAMTAGVPDAPTAVVAAATTTSTSLAVSWAASANNGGASISKYTVTASPGGKTCATANGTTTTCTVSGLTTKTSYTFTVVATNTNGDSPASSPSNSIIDGTPGAPQTPTAVATTSSTTATVSWTAGTAISGAATSKYTVTSSGGQTCSTANGTTTTCTVTGLTTGTVYTFTVTATNTNGIGEPSVPTAPMTEGTPGPPTGVSGTQGGTTQSTISWTAPAANGGSTITGYTATSSPGGLTCTTTGTSCTVTGLTNNQPYTFTVTATNARGVGQTSAASATVTP